MDAGARGTARAVDNAPVIHAAVTPLGNAVDTCGSPVDAAMPLDLRKRWFLPNPQHLLPLLPILYSEPC